MYYDLRTTNMELLKALRSPADIHTQASFCFSALWRDSTKPRLPSSLTLAAFGCLPFRLLQWPSHHGSKNSQQSHRAWESTLQPWPWSASTHSRCCPTPASSPSWRKGGTEVTSHLRAPYGDRAGENSWQRCGDALTLPNLTTRLSWGIKKHFCYNARRAKEQIPLSHPNPGHYLHSSHAWQSYHVQSQD